MGDYFASGRIIDWILGFLVVETVCLSLARIGGRRLFRPSAVLINSGAGATLLLALRAALRDSAWPPIAAWLLLALAFHVADLLARASARS